MNLSSFRVPNAMEDVFYVPDFVSKDEEEYLLRKISDSTSVKWKSLPNRRLQIWGGELTASNALIPQELPNFITTYPDIIPRLRATGVFSASRHAQPNHVIVNEYHPGQGIMPHEDGSTYHPVVATLSLGSHAVFNYHRYLPEQHLNPEETGILEHSDSISGRVIDPTPLLSLLLEPRSLVITTRALYTHHLHAIEPLSHDIIAPAEQGQKARPLSHGDDQHAVKVANWQMLTSEQGRRAALEGGVLARGIRVSLTCRDVERVVGIKTLGKKFTK